MRHFVLMQGTIPTKELCTIVSRGYPYTVVKPEVKINARMNMPVTASDSHNNHRSIHQTTHGGAGWLLRYMFKSLHEPYPKKSPELI